MYVGVEKYAFGNSRKNVQPKFLFMMSAYWQLCQIPRIRLPAYFSKILQFHIFNQWHHFGNLDSFQWQVVGVGELAIVFRVNCFCTRTAESLGDSRSRL